MNASCKSLCDAFANAIVKRDFERAHSLLAPWLKQTMNPSEIQRMVDAENEGLEHQPHSWNAWDVMLELGDLQPDPYGPPSRPIPNQITQKNFKGWLQIQFAPESSVHDVQNVCYDIWLAAVEHDDSLLVGYFEAWETT